MHQPLMTYHPPSGDDNSDDSRIDTGAADPEQGRRFARRSSSAMERPPSAGGVWSTFPSFPDRTLTDDAFLAQINIMCENLAELPVIGQFSSARFSSVASDFGNQSGVTEPILTPRQLLELVHRATTSPSAVVRCAVAHFLHMAAERDDPYQWFPAVMGPGASPEGYQALEQIVSHLAVACLDPALCVTARQLLAFLCEANALIYNGVLCFGFYTPPSPASEGDASAVRDEYVSWRQTFLGRCFERLGDRNAVLPGQLWLMLDVLFASRSSSLGLNDDDENEDDDPRSDASDPARQSLAQVRALARGGDWPLRPVVETIGRHITAFLHDLVRLLRSPNFLARRMSTKLATAILLSPQAWNPVSVELLHSPAVFASMMMSLEDLSPQIQVEAYHAIKCYIAFPSKVAPIRLLLHTNRDALAKYLSPGGGSATLRNVLGAQLDEERATLIEALGRVPPLSALEVTCVARLMRMAQPEDADGANE